MYHDYDDYADCPECGRYDHGFDMDDVRSRLTIDNCRCNPSCVCTAEERGEDYSPEECICRENGCECDHITVKVKVRRVFDRECSTCGGCDYRCVYDLSLDKDVIKTFSSEQDADAYVAKVFPTAQPPERDLAWESEAWLRRAEGWG